MMGSNLLAISEMKETITVLNEASMMYHKYDKPIMTDKEYDDLYFKLLKLESETKIIMANSPSQIMEGHLLECLPVIKHIKPMLSSDKTKDIEVIKKFCNKRLPYASWKLDGLTLVLTYSGGKLTQAVTRDNGEYGEDVTEQAKFINNIPLNIPYEKELVVRGEGVNFVTGKHSSK